jgi:hypothetical protein
VVVVDVDRGASTATVIQPSPYMRVAGAGEPPRSPGELLVLWLAHYQRSANRRAAYARELLLFLGWLRAQRIDGFAVRMFPGGRTCVGPARAPVAPGVAMAHLRRAPPVVDLLGVHCLTGRKRRIALVEDHGHRQRLAARVRATVKCCG